MTEQQEEEEQEDENKRIRPRERARGQKKFFFQPIIKNHSFSGCQSNDSTRIFTVPLKIHFARV